MLSFHLVNTGDFSLSLPNSSGNRKNDLDPVTPGMFQFTGFLLETMEGKKKKATMPPGAVSTLSETGQGLPTGREVQTGVKP